MRGFAGRIGPRPEEEEEVVANEEEAVTSTNDKSNDMIPVSSYGDVASWSDVQNGGMILAALAGGILHFVLKSVLESDQSIEKENPQIVFVVKLLTRVLPALVACIAVRSVSDSIKMFNSQSNLAGSSVQRTRFQQVQLSLHI